MLVCGRILGSGLFCALLVNSISGVASFLYVVSAQIPINELGVSITAVGALSSILMDLSDKYHPSILSSSFGVFCCFIGQLLRELIGLC